MSNPFLRILILFNLTFNTLYSQEKIETEFYSLTIPENTKVKAFDYTHEQIANIDAYQFNIGEKPKYILYLMSNKMNIDIGVTIDNYKDFLFDLGDLKILSVEDLGDKIKIHFLYNDNENINGIVYAFLKNDILNRFVLLLPNDNAKKTFQEEIEGMIDNINEKKNHW